ncbi:MAG: HEPN domain-containing protein [Candidatus Hydrogenedentes bacterium]|nr:HEPN domain-containing protein [Candidatus Hydrogenedentota bacterium]
MKRTDLQSLAEDRLDDAQALLHAQRWTAAYYLLGYAIECALKACAARQFQQDTVPEKTVVNDYYTHSIDRLLNISGVKVALQAAVAADPAFAVNWNTVRDWSVDSRYNVLITEIKAREMFDAVADQTSGVLTWLRTQW